MPKGVVKVELDLYVWLLFTMHEILYTNSKDQLKEEENSLIRLDKTAFHVKTVHVDQAATDAAHKILQHKFGKMSNNKLKEFMTNKGTINKHKIKELIAESSGKALLELPDTSELGSLMYVLFMPETFLFF